MRKYLTSMLSMVAVAGFVMAGPPRADADGAAPARDAAVRAAAHPLVDDASLVDGVLLDLRRGIPVFPGDRLTASTYVVLVPARILLGDREVAALSCEIFDDPWSLAGPPAMGAGTSHACALEDGVTWETADGGCKDLVTGLVWSTRGMGHPSGWFWNSAAQFVADSTEGGFDDWRMPTRDEMVTVAEHGAATHFSGFPCSNGGNWRLWSADTQGSQWAWSANVCSGETWRILQTSSISFVGVREAGIPDQCNNDGICEPGENCENCGDCPGKQNGPPSGRYCCGNGILEDPEQDGRCGVNP